MIVAGEASGDALGGPLAEALRRRLPSLRLSGVGGPAMRAAGVETWFDVADLEVVGIAEAAKRLPLLRRVKARILREADARRIGAAILIDYPGFNLHLAASLRTRGVKVTQFVAPQLWAWGRWRARRMARSLDNLLVILPFEPEFFQKWGIRSIFVGHPLIEALKNEPGEGAEERLGMEPGGGRPVIGVLPGSREREISLILPRMLEAVQILRAARPQARFLLPVAETLPWDEIASRAERAGVRAVRGARDVLRVSDAAMVASGTAILEAGLLGTPSVLAYAVHPLTFIIGRWLIGPAPDGPPLGNYFGLVNILAVEDLFPELIQDQLTPENLALEVRRILEDEKRTAYVKRRLQDVRHWLGEAGCFDRAAEAILEMVKA